MDPFTAALQLATEIFKLRAQWWDSLSPDLRTKLADSYAEGELVWQGIFKDLFNGLRPKS